MSPINTSPLTQDFWDFFPESLVFSIIIIMFSILLLVEGMSTTRDISTMIIVVHTVLVVP